MGRKDEKQSELWLSRQDVVRGPGHPFYEALNRRLSEAGFDRYVEGLCAGFYSSDPRGRPSLAPGIYFRLLLIGYFEGIGSERGIAWRVSDSLTLREFLGYELTERVPFHSTISRTRRLIAVEAHEEVFRWVLVQLRRWGLLRGKTLGVDGTTIEANAAMRSIVRKDSGEGYQQFLERLAEDSGISTPTRSDLARLDRRRKKKGSNNEWTHPEDPDARITKMKDGRTHLAHKAEHAVDLETGAVVAVTVQPADRGDTQTLDDTLEKAAENLAKSGEEGSEIRFEVVTDKGYHSGPVLIEQARKGRRTYLSEPRRGRRRWQGRIEEQQATYANRRRLRAKRGKALQRRRGELVERSFAHAYETGGLRRSPLRGRDNLQKRLLIHLGAFNLGLLLRKALGAGTPRAFADRARAVRAAGLALWRIYRSLKTLLARPWPIGEASRPLARHLEHRFSFA